MHKKVIKSQLTGVLYTPFVFLLAFAAFRYPHYVMMYGVAAGTSLLMMLALCILPVGRMQFDKPDMSVFSWLIKVVFFQIILILLFIAAAIAFFGAGPGFAHINLNIEAYQLAVNKHQWLLWSFFPWGGMIIWVLCIGYYYYVKKVGPYPHQAGCEFFKGFIEPKLKALMETTIYGVNTLIFSLVLAVAILLASYAIQIYYDLIPHTIVAPFAFTIIGVLTLFLLWRFSRKKLIILHKQGLHFSGWILIVFTLLLISLVSASVIMGWLFSKASFDPTALACGNCVRFFDMSPTEDRIAAYYWGWGLMWIPMAGSYFVKISKGRSIRQIILGLSLFPLCMMLALYLQPEFIPNLLIQFESLRSESAQGYKLTILLSFSAFCLLFCYFLGRKVHNSSLFNSGVLEDLKTQEPGRLSLREGAKLLGFSRICLPFFMGVITVLFVHMVGGWYLIQLNLVVFAPIMMHYLYLATTVLLVQFKREGLWMAPQKASPLKDS